MNDYEAFQRDMELEQERLEEIVGKAATVLDSDEIMELLVALGLFRRKQ